MRNKYNDLSLDDNVLEDVPLQEYPRMQFKRASYLCLNGVWDVEITKSKELPTKYSSQVVVPFPIESKLSKVNKELKKGEYIYYRRFFNISKSFNVGKIILHFDGIDQISDVYINEKLVMHHEGGYLPFEVDITNCIKEENEKYELVVKVQDDLNKMYGYGKQAIKSKGMWYTKTSGIWKTCWIESVPNKYFKNIKIDTTLDEVTIKVNGDILKKQIIIFSENKKQIYRFKNEEIKIKIKNPINWTPENPYLYKFVLKGEDDYVESYFALRTIKVGEFQGYPCLLLNDKPYFFNGLLDQGYYPDGLLTPKTYKKYEDEINVVKKLGFNTLRKHIKVEPDYFYYLCDKLGMIVFQDFVNNGSYSYLNDTILPNIGLTKRLKKGFTTRNIVKEQFKKETKETIAMLYNHPSVVYYTIFNEGWGQFDADKMYDYVKELDNTRIVDTTSGWFKSNKSDVISEHIYFKDIKFNKEMKPIILSEFGGYVYKVIEHSYNLSRTYGYKLFKTQEEYQESLNKLYQEKILPYAFKGLSGCIYTQISDVEDETNGILTYDRKIVKIKDRILPDINKI